MSDPLNVTFGIDTFGDVTVDADGGRLSDAEVIRNVVEQAVLAEQVGLDHVSIGEHHRDDFAVSSPDMVLAAIASRTERITLGTAVTVLSSDDPVRVYERFATLDALSRGRAEVTLGRGSFTESFPLFGYDLADYDALFAEKLELLLRLRDNEVVTWKGRHRAPIQERGVFPRPVQDPLPVWVAVGGTPASATRAGVWGLPMALAIIGGMPERFVPFAELFRSAARQVGHDPAPPLGINSHGLVADTAQEAADLAFPAYKVTMDRIGRERGWPPLTRTQFDASTTLRGANVIGSPEQVIEKLLYQHELFANQRFLMQMSVGTLPHAAVMRSIELFGTKVAPVVRAEVASRTAAVPG
jgi:probable LLM family oxidoreductase